jgi:16S rRNA (guanine527-N7)-methyltransferase
MSAPPHGDHATRERPTRDKAHPRDPSALAATLAADRDRALALTPVSRETLARLDRFVEVLRGWQRHTNLIAASSEPVLWTRHIADSLQLIDLARAVKQKASPESQASSQIWVDLGSGAGFPGLVIACALADEKKGAEVHLIESVGKKASFLREAALAAGVPAQVHAMRIADFVKQAPKRIDFVMARALAPLPKLLTEAHPLLKRGARGLFPKGQDVATELTEAAKCWNIEATLAQSRTDPKARIVVLDRAEPRGQKRH